MNSRWQASKIGLVNFWYYDEQEFPFVKGRMLLRGSNGSGKSVTMQSVVPLLLDGNMSPERLDPFGSRDRKMSSYLLEEDDEREERTGYLYLEFKRQDSENYLTIGMGIRARKGKPLDKWYFSLSDGRRIGKDFFLYRETDEKVPLTKRELQNRLSSGGAVFDRQADYMEYVNRHIFGFETVDEYREMIDLLIQLRTPKLSKDFKPSVINEILSDSLQPLSDDDLRPMSEAIENIDSISMNLKAKQEAKQAADKIALALGRYNRCILYEKAQSLEKESAQLSQTIEQIASNTKKKKECEERAVSLQDELVQMDAMRESMEKERESLNKSDAVALKGRELSLSKELTEHQTLFNKKKSSLAVKEDQYIDLQNRKKLEEDQSYEKETQIKDLLQAEALRIEEQRKKLAEKLGEKKKEALVLAQSLYLDCNLEVFERAEEAAFSYTADFEKLVSVHELYRNSVHNLQLLEADLRRQEEDLDELRYDMDRENRNLAKISQELDSIKKQLELTDYNQIKERLDQCLRWLNEYPKKMQTCVTEKTQKLEEAKRLEEQIQNDKVYAEELEKKVSWLTNCFESERDLGYIPFAKQEEKLNSAQIVSLLSGSGRQNRDTLVKNLNQVLFENKAYLSDYDVDQTTLFEKMDESSPQLSVHASRADLTAKFKGVQIPFVKLPKYLEEEIDEQSTLLKDEDKSLFQDILANTMGRKIRAKINSSNAWVEKMNALMNAMNTSSGLKLSLRWKSKTAEKEEQLDTNELVGLLKRDAHLLNPEDFEKLSKHFRSKVEQARRNANDSAGVSFYQVMKDTLDYRKWFEFQLFSQKNNERRKELTNSVFGTFSGGEKAMSMYVPLFSAVVAKYQGGRSDAPRLISLDEAFAGVDSRNIRDMFRLMSEFEFDFIINSQVLWGDSNTLDALAIYQLIRPENAKFVSVMPYLWNGYVKKLLENEEEVELEGAELTATRE